MSEDTTLYAVSKINEKKCQRWSINVVHFKIKLVENFLAMSQFCVQHLRIQTFINKEDFVLHNSFHG